MVNSMGLFSPTQPLNAGVTQVQCPLSLSLCLCLHLGKLIHTHGSHLLMAPKFMTSTWPIPLTAGLTEPPVYLTSPGCFHGISKKLKTKLSIFLPKLLIPSLPSWEKAPATSLLLQLEPRESFLIAPSICCHN